MPLRILPILIVDFKMNMKKPQYPFIHYLIQFFSKKLSSSTIVSYLYLVCLVLLFQINKNNTCSTVSTDITTWEEETRIFNVWIFSTAIKKHAHLY